MSITPYFENIQAEIVRRLSGAQKSISVAMAWLTDATLWQALCAAQRRGVRVRLLLAKDEINERSSIDYQELRKLGGEVYIKDMSHLGTYSKMHNKFCIIDAKTLLTGSYNWTNQAPRNDENILVAEDASLCSLYAGQFEQLLQGTINIQHIDSDDVQFPNAYQVRATRDKPTALLLLVDQSGSMESTAQYAGRKQSKAAIAAQFINKILEELLTKCTRDGGLRDYVDVCLIGYGGNTADYAWLGGERTKAWRSTQELSDSAEITEIESIVSVRGVQSTRKIPQKTWIQPRSSGMTPMGAALRKTYALLREWVNLPQHKDCLPPTVINISDGDANDMSSAELIALANDIKSLHTDNGRVLLFNCHIGDDDANAVRFPRDKTPLPSGDAHAETMLEMSSLLPKIFYDYIPAGDIPDFDRQERYYGMFYSVSVVELLRFLRVGTIGTTR